MNMNPIDIKYEHNLKKEVVLERPLPPEYHHIFCSPYYYELLYHGLYRFYNNKDEKCAENHVLEMDEIFKSVQPETEGNDKNIYKVIKKKSDPNNVEITFIIIKPSAKSVYIDLKYTCSYSVVDNIAKVGNHIEANLKNVKALKIIEMIVGHILLRFQRLAINPIETINELKLVSTSNFSMLNDANFYGLPYGFRADLIVQKPIDNVRHAISHSTILQNILPNTLEVSSKEGILKLGDKFKAKIKNLSTFGVLTEEDVSFSVVCINNERIGFISDNKVNHFHKFGFEVSLNKRPNENETSLAICIYYHNSNMVSAAKFAVGLMSLVSSNTPNLPQIMAIRARNMLEASVRLIYRHINNCSKLAIQQEHTPAVGLKSP